MKVKMKEVDSSNIAKIGYDYDENILYVEFLKGGIYSYYNVPENIYDALKNADSKGRAFWRLIREKYDYKRIYE